MIKIKSTIIILRSNPVDPDSRVEKEANTLIKAGYEVKILAWDRNTNYKIKESYLNLSSGKVKIYRFGIPGTFGGGYKNLKSFIIFQIRLISWLIKNRDDYQIVHACDFDTAYSAYLCSQITKKKLVFDIFDYLFTKPKGNFKLFKRYIIFLQKKIINYADATIICTEQRKQQISGSNPKKLIIIHNSPPNISDNLTKLNLNENKTKIAYVGILQDNRFLLELAEIIKENNDWELHIGGFGKYEDYFYEISQMYPNIIYYGKLPYEKVLKLESSCDILTAIYDPKIDNHFYAAPNKFYEGLMLGKPLIMVKDTGMSEIIEEYNIGELMEYNIDSLKNAIEKLVGRKKEWIEISYKMKKIYKQNYSWDSMEERLIALYKEIL